MHGKDIRYVWCDNTDENEAYRKLYKQEGMGVKFECTIPMSQHQNGKVEQMFVTSFNKVCAILWRGFFPCVLRNRIWTKSVNIDILLEKGIWLQSRDNWAHFRFFGKEKKQFNFIAKICKIVCDHVSKQF